MMDYRFSGRFRLTQAEYSRALSPGGLRQTYTISALLAVIGIGYFIFFTDRSLELSNLVYLATMLGFAIALPIMVKHNHRKQYRKDPANTGLWLVELSNDDIATTTQSSHVITSWHEVAQVESRDGLLFFHSLLGGFHLLPERLFKSAAAAEACRQFIRTRVANVKLQPLNMKWIDVDHRIDDPETDAPLDTGTADRSTPEIPRSVHYAANLLLFCSLFTAVSLAMFGWLTLWPPPQQPSPAKTPWLLYSAMGMMGLTLVSSLPAGLLLKLRHRHSKPAALTAFVLMLPAFPYGPFFGPVGIGLLLARDAKRYFAALTTPPAKEPPLPAIATHHRATHEGSVSDSQTFEVRGDMNAQEIAIVRNASPGGSGIVFMLKMSAAAVVFIVPLLLSGTSGKGSITNIALLVVIVFVVAIFLIQRRRDANNAVADVADYRYLISEEGITSLDRRKQHQNWPSLRRAATIRGVIVLYNVTGVPVVAIPIRHFRDEHEKTAVLTMLRRHVADCSQL